MKFQTPEGHTLKQYENPEEAGWVAWVEDGEGAVVGYIKAEDDEAMVTVAEAEAARAAAEKAAAEAATGDGTSARTHESAEPLKPKPRRRKPSRVKGDRPKPGETPSLHQLNEMRRANDRKLAGGKDPLKRPFKSVADGQAYLAQVRRDAERTLGDARKQANAILEEAQAEADRVTAAALESAEAIRAGAKAEAAATS